MANLIVGAIVLSAIGAAIAYIIREKKKGVTCIGCPHAVECAKKHMQGSCGCHTEEK